MDWPTTVEGWTAIAANVATVLGAIALTFVVNIKLGASLYYQRRAMLAQELAAQPPASPHLDPTNSVLNTIYAWAERREKFVKGFSVEEFRKLRRAERIEYVLWVSRLISGLDIVVMDDRNLSQATEAKIAVTLAEHAPALITGTWPFRWIRYPVSAKMRSIINKTITKSSR